ncbi:hypothetical protein IAS59_002628 [Cryptococcus gattii]
MEEMREDSLQNKRNFYDVQSDSPSEGSAQRLSSNSSRFRGKAVRAQSNSHISALSQSTSPFSRPLPAPSP